MMSRFNMGDTTSQPKGFTLLETLLVVAVMAVIGIVATKYYRSVSTSNRANEVIIAVSHVRAATSAYSQDRGAFPASTQALVDQGFLAESYRKLPWGEDILLGKLQTDSGRYGITIDNIPSTVMCKMIYDRIKTTLNPKAGEGVDYWGDSTGPGAEDGEVCTTVSVSYRVE